MHIDEGTYLRHYGVKGMKWGVRKQREPSRVARSIHDSSRKAVESGSYSKTALKVGAAINKSNAKRMSARQLKKKQKAYDKNVRKNWYKAYNNAANIANTKLIPEINSKYSPEDLKDKKILEKYHAEYQRRFNEIYQMEFDKMFGARPK